MIIDVFKDYNFFKNLESYNNDIRDVCKNYKFVREGEEYDLNNKIVSGWFDPDHVKDLYISEFYPKKVPLPYHPKFNLILHCYNYVSMYVINKLYSDRKDILIEDQAGGMGRFLYYLSKLGFSNFHNVDNFSQLCVSLFEDLMKKGSIQCKLN